MPSGYFYYLQNFDIFLYFNKALAAFPKHCMFLAKQILYFMTRAFLAIKFYL